MKKRTKIILSCVLGVVVLGGIGLVAALNTNNVSGTVLDNIQLGTSKFDWIKYDVHIDLDDTDKKVYNTNHEGDYIKNINFYKNSNNYYVRYDLNFNTSDSFEAFFIFKSDYENGVYVSATKNSNNSLYGDCLKIRSASKNLDRYYISEIYIRTKD